MNKLDEVANSYEFAEMKAEQDSQIRTYAAEPKRVLHTVLQKQKICRNSV